MESNTVIPNDGRNREVVEVEANSENSNSSNNDISSSNSNSHLERIKIKKQETKVSIDGTENKTMMELNMVTTNIKNNKVGKTWNTTKSVINAMMKQSNTNQITEEQQSETEIP